MYRQALVPLDGSELAECALNHVRSMLKDGLIGRATLFHAVRVEIPWVKIDDQFEHLDVSALRERAVRESERYLAGVAARLASEGVEVKTASRQALKPGGAILDYAAEQGMDVIVLATHGHSGMKRMLLGSVAFDVLNQSPVPVLLIRPAACQV